MGKCSMGKSTISMLIFNGYVKLPEGSIEKKTNQHKYQMVPHT